MLLDHWLAIMTPAAGVPEVGMDLIRRYEEPHRHYHTTAHLAAVLATVDEHADLAGDPAAVRLAAWYHDAVYDPTAGDNEEASARLAVDTLPGLGVPLDRVAEVARLVRLTAGHHVEPGDRDGALLADADLAVLASPPDRYERYADAVRREYAHVPDQLWRIGRAAVLESLLALDELYRIVPARAEWTAAAHLNLRRELATLGRG